MIHFIILSFRTTWGTWVMYLFRILKISWSDIQICNFSMDSFENRWRPRYRWRKVRDRSRSKIKLITEMELFRYTYFRYVRFLGNPIWKSYLRETPIQVAIEKSWNNFLYIKSFDVVKSFIVSQIREEVLTWKRYVKRERDTLTV